MPNVLLLIVDNRYFSLSAKIIVLLSFTILYHTIFKSLMGLKISQEEYYYIHCKYTWTALQNSKDVTYGKSSTHDDGPYFMCIKILDMLWTGLFVRMGFMKHTFIEHATFLLSKGSKGAPGMIWIQKVYYNKTLKLLNVSSPAPFQLPCVK